MNPIPHILRATGLAAALFATACGGGDAGGVVRTSQPPPPPPPRPPPPPPPPVVTIDEGSLSVDIGNTLSSDVIIGANGTLILAGTIEGNVTNNGAGELQTYADGSGAAYVEGGHMWLFGTVIGNVVNNGPMQLTGNFHWAGTPPLNRVQGDFRQNATGTLGVPLPYGDSDVSYPLSITGRADIQGGTLWLYREWDWDWGSFPLPTKPVGVHVLHADGGVFGEFDQWVSPGLFIEGNARYETNDVWFDLYRVSVAEAMATAGARPLAIASASNIDAALARADEFASMPATTLTDAQRRFLASVAAFLWTPDMARANRALDSLAGHAHVSMQDMLHERTAEISSRLDKRLADLQYSMQPQAWSDDTLVRFAGQSFDGLSAGVDQWLSPRLLVGSSVTSGQASLRFDHLGGQGWGESPGAGIHAHYRGDGWHATGMLGAGHTRLQLQRPIELGAAGHHLAHSQRSFVHGFAHGELGRDMLLGGSRLVPFVALDYSIARSDAFAEQGDTGLELIAGPSRQARFSAAVGARYARDWTLGRHLLRLELDARYHRDLLDEDSLRAAFRGVPDVWFDVPAERERGASELRVGLGGEFGRHSLWSMDYAQGFDGDRRDAGWMFGLRHAF